MSKKLVVVGDGMVGKTALLQSFLHGSFHNKYIPTVFETSTADVRLPDGRAVTLCLWDTGGQEDFDQIRQLAYPRANVILLCYAVDLGASLQNIVHLWLAEVRQFCPTTPIILVGCKSDLRCPQIINSPPQSRHRPHSLIDPREAATIQRQIGAQANIECSAKTQSNILTVFQLAANIALDNNICSYVPVKPNKASKLRHICCCIKCNAPLE